MHLADNFADVFRLQLQVQEIPYRAVLNTQMHTTRVQHGPEAWMISLLCGILLVFKFPTVIIASDKYVYSHSMAPALL
jgi:hypothetical protein